VPRPSAPLWPIKQPTIYEADSDAGKAAAGLKNDVKKGWIQAMYKF